MGYAKYDQESYVIPAEVDGMPVVEIEAGAFYGNKNIKDITFPDGKLTIVSGTAFYNCTALEKLNFSGSSIKRIESKAFYGCSALASIDDWGVVDSLGQNAFQNCTALTVVNIGASITKVASTPFSGCTNLKTVRFENTTTRIKINNSTSSMFYNCPVEKVYLGRKLVNNNGGVTFNNGCLFKSHTTITEFELGELIDTIPNSLFGGMTSTMTVKALNVVHIDEQAFLQSKNITLIAPKLKSIGANAFKQATLPSFDFSTVEKIGTMAFYKCTIDNIVLPNKVKEVYRTAFGDIVAKTFRIEDGDEAIELGVDETITDLSDITRYNNKDWLSSQTLEELYIGRPIGHAERLTAQNNALIFYAGGINYPTLKALKTLTLTKVSALGSGSFASCTKLESVNIPLLTAIPSSCFYKCSSLTWEGINLPIVTSIGKSAFSGCTSLKEFTLPSRVTTLGDGAVPEEGGNVFAGCTGIQKFTIEDNSTELYSTGFGNMANLVDLYIGRELSQSGNGITFSQTTLKHVTFGSQITSLNCTSVTGYRIQGANVETVRCLSTTPIALTGTGDLFPKNVVQQNAALVVPTGTKDAYKAAPVWKGFENIVEDTQTVPLNNAGDGTYWATYYTEKVGWKADANTIVYTANVKGDNKVQLSPVSSKIIPAGSAVILMSNAVTTTLTYDGTLATLENNSLQGSATATPTPANANTYMLTKGAEGVGFYKWTGATIPAGRAYLVVTGGSQARSFLSLSDGGATAIEAVEAISDDGPLYDLAGRRAASKPAPGIYVRDGKKVIIK